MAKQQSLLFRILGENRDFIRKMRQVQTIAKSTSAGIKKAFDFSKISLGLGTLAGGAGITYMFANIIQSSTQFQKNMAEVNTIAKLSQKELSALKEDVLALGEEIGLTSEELTKGLYQALSAGVPANNAIDFMRVAGKAAIAGVTDLNTAVDGLTTVINAYHLDISQATKVSDIMFQTVKLGKTTFGELSAVIGRVAPLANAAGVSFEHLAGAIATITKQGVKTDEAVTELRQIFSKLISPSTELRNKLDEIAKSQKVANWQALGLQKTLQLLYQSVNGNKDALQKLFPEMRAVNGVIQLVGVNANTAANDLDAMRNSANSASEAYAIMAETFTVKAKKFEASITRLKVALGNELLPVLSDVADGWTAIFERQKALDKERGTKTGFFGTIAKSVVGAVTNTLGLESGEQYTLTLTDKDIEKLEKHRKLRESYGNKTLAQINQEKTKQEELKKTEEEKQKKKLEQLAKQKKALEFINQNMDKIKQEIKLQELKNKGLDKEAFIQQKIAQIKEQAKSKGLEVTPEQTEKLRALYGKQFEAQKGGISGRIKSSIEQAYTSLRRVGGQLPGMAGAFNITSISKKQLEEQKLLRKTVEHINAFLENYNKNPVFI